MTISLGLLSDPTPVHLGARPSVHGLQERLDRDIQASLFRANSPYTLRDVYDRLWRGDLRLAIGNHLTASATVEDGKVEIVHFGGEWDEDEARWMQGIIEEFSRETGFPWTWRGRRGWMRFLRMKGYRLWASEAVPAAVPAAAKATA